MLLYWSFLCMNGMALMETGNAIQDCVKCPDKGENSKSLVPDTI